MSSRVVGEAATAQELLGVLCDTSPDLILLDWELPGLDPSAPLTELRGLRPRVCVIAMSSRPDIGALTQDAGCQAFVSKGDPPERLLAAVASVRTP